MKTPKEYVIGKTSKEIAENLNEHGIRYTFSELCYDSDEYTKRTQEASMFSEYGYVGDNFLSLHLLKMPVYNKNKVVGTVGLGRDVTYLLQQQDAIEHEFLHGDPTIGINKFLAYHQEFKNLKNISFKHDIYN